MTYAEKLLDPRWQKKRLEIFTRDNFCCVHCSDSTATLHVHHTEYYQEPWDAPNELLKTVCHVCHLILHFIKKTFPPDNLSVIFLLKERSGKVEDVLVGGLIVKKESNDYLVLFLQYSNKKGVDFYIGGFAPQFFTDVSILVNEERKRLRDLIPATYG